MLIVPLLVPPPLVRLTAPPVSVVVPVKLDAPLICRLPVWMSMVPPGLANANGLDAPITVSPLPALLRRVPLLVSVGAAPLV